MIETFRRRVYLRDDFTAPLAVGTIDGTSPLESNVGRVMLDTVNAATIENGNLTFVTTANTNEPRIVYNYWFTRRNNPIFYCKFRITGTTSRVNRFGFTPNLASVTKTGMSLNSTTFNSYETFGSGSRIILSPVVANTDYEIWILLRRRAGHFIFVRGGGVYTYPTLLWKTSTDTDMIILPVIESGISTDTFTADAFECYNKTFVPLLLLSDSISSTFPVADGLAHTEGINNEVGSGGGGITWQNTATWAYDSVNGRVYNTPTEGSELLTNGNYETGSPPSSWFAGSGAVLTSVTDNRPGSSGTKALHVASSTTATAFASQQIVSIIGEFYKATGWVKNVDSPQLMKHSLTTTGFSTMFQSLAAGAAGWEQVTVTGRAVDTGMRLTASQNLSNSPAGTGGRFDDASLVKLNFNTLYTVVNYNTGNITIISEIFSLLTGTQAGFIINLDSISTPLNFILIYHTGTTVVVDKYVAGVLTANLMNTASTFSSGAALYVRKIDTKIRVYYNGALIGSELTISDAGVINNTLHGFFSTHPAAQFNNTGIHATGVEGQYESYLQSTF